MLKFSVGWQDLEREPFSAIVKTYRHAVGEVYFPWPGIAISIAPAAPISPPWHRKASRILRRAAGHSSG